MNDSSQTKERCEHALDFLDQLHDEIGVLTEQLVADIFQHVVYLAKQCRLLAIHAREVHRLEALGGSERRAAVFPKQRGRRNVQAEIGAFEM